jgi:CRP/FNR family transcriptional regulator, cyclic AMP receptor protein
MAAGPGDLVVSPEMREQLLCLATCTSKAKGTILFRHGEAVRGLFLIRSGKVSLALDGANASFPSRILGAGSVVGLPATVAGSPYSLTAQVVEDAELAFVPRDAVVDCLRQNPDLCFEVMDMLSGEISGTRFALKRCGTVPPRD